jgi:hypothetical protein
MIHSDILAACRARQTRRHRQSGCASATRTTPRLAAAGTLVVLRDGSAVLTMAP